MAILWQNNVGDRHYQLRHSGTSLRLYTNGVFHSQFNPNYPLGGHIWDLLVLPALFAPQKIKRILVLGLGGGAAVRTLQYLLPGRHLTAVEIDSTHIYIARRHFGLKSNNNTTLIRADAMDWLHKYRGEKFDFILDDLFIDDSGNPDRAVSVNNHWFHQLRKHLTPHGVIAINFDSLGAWKKSALAHDVSGSRSFPNRFSLSQPGYENRIIAFLKQNHVAKDLDNNLQTLEKNLKKGLRRRLNFKIRSI